MSLSEYQELRIIGKGSYGEVWLIKHKVDRKQVKLISYNCFCNKFNVALVTFCYINGHII